MPRQQEETLPFTREQYEALIEATFHYDGRGTERNGGYDEFTRGCARI